MTQTKRFTLHARIVLCALLLNFTVSAFAAISVTGGGAGPFTFSGPDLPAISNGWSTLTIGNNAANVTTTAAMDAAVQTRNANTVLTTLGHSPTLPPSANAIARWNSNNAALYLQSVPTGNDYTLLMATLQNDTGGDVGSVTVNYNYGLLSTPTEDAVRGFRVFYSLSGLPNEWTLIPEFSSDATTILPAGAKSATVNVVWPSGTPMYILWADDNGSGTEAILTIDDFAVTTTSLNITAITITNQPQSTVALERDGSASFTVGAGGSPQSFHWLSNGVPIVGANSATYSIPSVHFSANGAVFSVVVSNSLGGVTSTGATLTVTPDTTSPTLVSAAANSSTEVVLTFSEPMNPTQAETGIFVVYETGNDPVGTQVPVNTSVVNGNIITLTLGAALTDGVLYSVQVYDAYDTSLGAPDPGNPLIPYPADIAILRRVSLILTDFDGPNNVWKFTNGVFGTGWETTGYNDANWASGQVGIGRDASVNGVPIRTDAYPANNGTPYFFRRHVYLPAGTAGATLSIRHVFEDGAVVFINGQEAGRYNVPGGTLTAATLATGNATDPTPISASVPLATNGLVQGDNVIAVVVYQSAAGSTDMEFAMELTANVLLLAAGPPSNISPPASQSVGEGANVIFSVVADGALPLSYQWTRNGSPLPDATNGFYNIQGVLPSQAGDYRVTVSNAQGSSNSAIAVLTVTPDNIAPVFASAIGAANLTNITLTINDAFGLNQTAAETESNYAVALTAGGGNLVIESAVLVNPTTVLLTTSPRTALQNYTITLSGIVDRSEAANVATPSSRPVQATVVLMSYNQVWRYDETGNDLGSTWSDVGYNDSGWLSGAGFLTFETSVGPLTLFTNLAGGNGSNTVLNLTNQTLGGIGGTNITFYFRTTVGNLPFNPNAPGNAVRATAYLDDGGVIYVNGGEQMRYNITNTPGVANYTNLAIAGSTEGAGGLITSNLLGFAQANNVIAAEVHQNTMTSSDIAWGLQLEGLVTTFAPGCGPLHIVDNGNGTVTITWSGAGVLQGSSDISNPLNWANIGGAPVSGYTVSSAGAPKFFRLNCP